MSSAADFDTNDDMQKLYNKWQAAGHEVIYERAAFRHAGFKKDFEPDTVVRIGDAPILMRADGQPLKVSECLPERADLALDMDGKLLPQHEFEKRYLEYLDWFSFIEGSDPKAEPIPHVENYIKMVPDTFSESNGLVEAHFDARKPPEEERTHHYDPIADKEVEIQRETNTVLMESIKELLAERKNAPEEPKKRGPGRPPKHQSVEA